MTTSTRNAAMIGLFAAVLIPSAAFADTTTTVNYTPAALEGNFSAPEPTNDNVKYTITLGSDSTNVYITLQAMPAGQGLDHYNSSFTFTNLYFGVGASYNTGTNLGFEFENNRAFIPGGANGPADLLTYGVVTTVTPGTSYDPMVPGSQATGPEVQITLPFSYLINDPDHLGFSTISAANPNVELRDTQSFSYSYVGGATFGPDRFGVVTYAPAPEPSSVSLLAAGALAAAFAFRRSRTKRSA